MELAFVVLVFSILCFSNAPTLVSSISKPGCPEKCGNVTIPYPFRIGYPCSANPSFAVICKYSAGNSSRMVPFLNSINLEIVNVSIYGVFIVNLPVSPMACLYLNGKGRPTMKEVSHHLEGIKVEIIDCDGFSSISEIVESLSSDES